MCEFDLQFPGYGLGKHKGYGTPFHRLAYEAVGIFNYSQKKFFVPQKLNHVLFL